MNSKERKKLRRQLEREGKEIPEWLQPRREPNHVSSLAKKPPAETIVDSHRKQAKVGANAKTLRQDTATQKPPAPEHKRLKSWWISLPKWKKILGSLGPLLPLIFAFYFQYAPSWSLDLPSASFRPENPFTAVFTITNVGYLPASRISVQCVQNMIEYYDPPDTFSAGLMGEPSVSNWQSRNGKVSVTCPQVVAGLKIWNRVLSLDEIREMYERGLKEGPPLRENPHISWIDLVFRIKYAPIALFPIWTWTEELRVKGELGEDGKFVWMYIPVNQIYDRPSYRAWENQKRIMGKQH
jgi:hypothetical protein